MRGVLNGSGEFMTLSPIAVFALRQVTDRVGVSAGLSPCARELYRGGALAEDRSPPEFDPKVLARATRHTWLALEIALSGPAFQERLGSALPATRANIFRQQLESLIDLLGRAGLDSDDPDVCRRYSAELRATRPLNLPPDEGAGDWQQDTEGPFLNGSSHESSPAGRAGHALTQIARRSRGGRLSQPGTPG